MATQDALTVFLRSLEKKTYYAILRVAPDAPAREIKAAFHDFSLLYHPDRYVDSPLAIGQVATAIFKRGVEAYRCLSRPATRSCYDEMLARGVSRPDPGQTASAPQKPAAERTLETIARTARAQQFARKADRLLAIGHLEQARVQLVSACQCEPYNEELSERLALVYEALALEPP
jgi:curved DNA-binding protein CbpA